MTRVSMRVALLLSSILTVLHSNAGSAGEVAKPASAKSNQASNLPLCIDAETDLKSVADHQEANRKNDFKYDMYKKLLSASSESEMLARLAYAETKAANCPDNAAKILPLITDVIANRIDIRKKKKLGVESVLFQRNQFASSLNIYEESRYREFLCPKDSAAWAKAVTLAKTALESKPRKSVLPPDVVNYFLYQHSPKYTKEPWDFVVFPVEASPELRSCIRFFHVPNWK